LGRSLSFDFNLFTFDCLGCENEFPEFTYLRQNEDEIGRQAAEILRRIIQGKPS